MDVITSIFYWNLSWFILKLRKNVFPILPTLIVFTSVQFSKKILLFRSSTIAMLKVINTQPQLSTFLFHNARDLHNWNCIAKTTNLWIPSLIWNRKKSTIPVCMSVSFINLNTISILCTFAVYLLSTFQKMYGICPPIC